MKIVENGLWVEVDQGQEDDLSKVLDLVCVCGHKLSEHGSWMSWSTNTMFPSQCVMCGLTDDKKEFKCKKFTMKVKE